MVAVLEYGFTVVKAPSYILKTAINVSVFVNMHRRHEI